MIHLLVAHVSAGEIQHVVATLPRSIVGLWRELAGDTPPQVGRTTAAIRRTGYTR